MDDKEYILEMFQEGLLCDCKTDPIWDRLHDENNRFIGYELAHKITCVGKIKAAIVLQEMEENGEI